MTDTPSNGQEPDRDPIQDADDELLRGLNRRKRSAGSERALLPEYEDVRSHSELFEVAESGWAEGTSFHPRLNGCDLEALKENFSEVEAVSREFPLLIGCVSICQPTARGATYAQVRSHPRSPSRVVLSINSEIFKQNDVLRENYAYDLSRGYHPEGTTSRDILVHEMGHAIEHVLASRRYPYSPTRAGFAIDTGEISREVIAEAYNRISSRSGFLRRSRAEMTEGISVYAKTNSKETMAEALSDYHANKENDNDISIEIISVLKEWSE